MSGASQVVPELLGDSIGSDVSALGMVSLPQSGRFL